MADNKTDSGTTLIASETGKSGLTQEPQKLPFSKIISSGASKRAILNALSDEKRCARFISTVTSAVAANEELQKCEAGSIITSALIGESLGLSPSVQVGQYYLIPYWNGKAERYEAKISLSYKGLLQLALRSGQYKKFNVLGLKAGELKSWNPLTEEIKVDLIQDIEQREREETTGYVALFECANGFSKTIYWSKERMEAHALKYSKGYAKKTGSTFWERDFDSMAYKTMVRQILNKWGIMSVDMQTAFENDTDMDDDNYSDAIVTKNANGGYTSVSIMDI